MIHLPKYRGGSQSGKERRPPRDRNTMEYGQEGFICPPSQKTERTPEVSEKETKQADYNPVTSTPTTQGNMNPDHVDGARAGDVGNISKDGRTYNCESCHSGFPNPAGLRDHIKQKHSTKDRITSTRVVEEPAEFC